MFGLRRKNASTNKYLVIYEQADDGVWEAYVPDIPDVVALGASREELAEQMQIAVSTYAADLQLRGQPLPRARHAAGTVAT